MSRIKQSLSKISLFSIFIMLISCSVFNGGEKDLPPIYFSDSPTVIVISSPTSITAPTPIPTLIPIPTPKPITNFDLIYEAKSTMSSVYSYQYDLEADVFMDAGGIILPVNMIGNGVTEGEQANNYFATELFGMTTPTYYAQDGDLVFIRNLETEAWEEFPSTPIGIIPIDFWQNTGTKLLDLEFNHSHSQYKDSFILTSNDSKADSLLEILGVDNTEYIVLENLNLQIDINKDNFYINSIKASFVIANGGQFISEVIGFPALIKLASEIGSTEVLIEIKFSNFDKK